MPRRRRGSRPNAPLTRSVEISSFRASVRLSVDEPKDPQPLIEVQPWLELQGTLKEPLKDVRDVVLSVYPKADANVGTARPASVAAIIQARPKLEVVASCPRADFEHIWTFALTGHLKHAHLVFTKPHYNRVW